MEKRAIKYRMPIFDKNGKFNQFFYWGFDSNMNFTPPAGSVSMPDNEFRKIQNQYTGLTDDFGEELFEDDIVESIYQDDWHDLPYYTKGVVIFADGQYVLQLKGKDMCDHTPRLIDMVNIENEVKIIGNIHQNPELL